MKKLMTFCGCLLALGAMAQPGINEMQQAQQDLASSFYSALGLALALAGICGIFGAVRIYHNWQMGRPKITEEVAAWFFAALFMVLAGVFSVLFSVFNLSFSSFLISGAKAAAAFFMLKI
jgi:hypothetical protein